MKFAVGVMLSSFGMFWGAEGAGARWPADDGALLAIIPMVLVVSLIIANVLRSTAPREPREYVEPAASESVEPAVSA